MFSTLFLFLPVPACSSFFLEQALTTPPPTSLPSQCCYPHRAIAYQLEVARPPLPLHAIALVLIEVVVDAEGGRERGACLKEREASDWQWRRLRERQVVVEAEGRRKRDNRVESVIGFFFFATFSRNFT